MNENVAIVHEIFTGLMPVLFGITIVVCSTWAVIAMIRSLRHRADTRVRAELYRQMLDKFGSAPEFLGFLESDAGRSFIEENTSESVTPMNKILVSTQIGVVTALLGVGLIILEKGPRLGGDINLIFYMVGMVALLIGTGFLVSAGIAYWLCSRWGLLKIKEKAGTAAE